MTRRVQADVIGILAVAIAIIAAPALAQTPEGVSPGAVDRITEVEGRCPTFIWGGVTGAQAFELVVYRLPDELQASHTSEYDLSPSDQVLYSKTPGWATAWQPELANGLDPGGTYVWFVRAVLREETGEVVEAGDWSAARFFSIPAMPSAMEVEEALGVLRRYTELGGDRRAELDEPAAETRSSGSGRSAAGRQFVGAPGSVKSVPTATAAIKGTIPDPTGENYGVVGISSSPDGAGVAAANAGGGPDLVLDGSLDGFTDTLLWQHRLDRPSAESRVFNILNSGGGGMTLRVEGVDVVTTLTDQDTLAAVAPTCAQWQVPKWDGGGWICADDRNLLASLGCTTDQIAKYNGTAWVCAPDNDTTYSAGPGLIVDGGEIRIDWHALQTSLTTLDSTGDVGLYTAIAIGADGLGLISYYDSTNGDLKVAHCDDAICSSSTLATLDSTGEVGWYTSIAIGADGLGLISYFDNTNGDLKVAHCSNTECSAASTTTLDNVGTVGIHSSIAIGADGLGLISYGGLSPDHLNVAHCDDVLCASASLNTLDDVWLRDTSVAIGTDGLGLIVYTDQTSANLLVAHCDDVLCASATLSTLDSSASVGWWASAAIGADGLGLISYNLQTSFDLKVAHCGNLDCTSATLYTVDSVGMVGAVNSVAIGADWLGLISYLDSTNSDLKVAHCNDIACSSATTATVDVPGYVGGYTSVAIGTDGLGLISYFDATNGDLKVAHLGIGVP